MDAGSSHSHTLLWKDGRLQDAARAGGSLASLCAAIEQAVHAHRASGTPVRAVILMLDEAPSQPHVESTPVYVDVYDSGFGHDAGYGHGI
jgi:hypothetical protein